MYCSILASEVSPETKTISNALAPPGALSAEYFSTWGQRKVPYYIVSHTTLHTTLHIIREDKIIRQSLGC
jgi:hypothetical protein